MKTDIVDALSTQIYPLPSPTIIFIKPNHLGSLTSAILGEAQKSQLMYPFAWRHKLAGVTEGFITKDSLWDRLLFDSARAKIVGDAAGTLRGIIVSGGKSFYLYNPLLKISAIIDTSLSGPLEASVITPARIAFSVPIVNSFVHPLGTAPVLSSHPLDLQTFPSSASESDSLASPLAHVGPPGINVEVKLVGVDDALVESGGDPVGVLLVRGAPIGRLLSVGEESDIPVSVSVEEAEEGWVGTGVRAKVQTNGAFKIVA